MYLHIEITVLLYRNVLNANEVRYSSNFVNIYPKVCKQFCRRFLGNLSICMAQCAVAPLGYNRKAKSFLIWHNIFKTKQKFSKGMFNPRIIFPHITVSGFPPRN